MIAEAEGTWRARQMTTGIYAVGRDVRSQYIQQFYIGHSRIDVRTGTGTVINTHTARSDFHCGSYGSYLPRIVQRLDAARWSVLTWPRRVWRCPAHISGVRAESWCSGWELDLCMDKDLVRCCLVTCTWRRTREASTWEYNHRVAYNGLTALAVCMNNGQRAYKRSFAHNHESRVGGPPRRWQVQL